ncbi:nuclear transport factor 2 family protein [Micromonospora sp. WMMD1155]|uniref:nuclear transport factor 2 family protein n=1 Tax=Micromonospora sp. WMMD1155 TaxID=3016094 RepID=UPI00249B9DB2|nr:nuclear transport factor 2 family protein [Micromonospora sp. WMMD1155]WFE53277.1 nuclear transport factor 2 family protein [Micromonospora sp. WMMD1155]
MTTDSTPPSSTGQPDRLLVRSAVDRFFAARLAGASPEELAEHFHENVDWYIQGDTKTVPWIGRKTGRAGIVEHFTQLAQNVRAEAFEIDTTMAHGNRAVVLGTFRARMVATERVVDSEYVFDIAVDDTGLITRYHMLEDSWAISEANRS